MKVHFIRSEVNAGPSLQVIAFGVPYSQIILKNIASAIVPDFWPTKGIAFTQLVYLHTHTRIIIIYYYLLVRDWFLYKNPYNV